MSRGKALAGRERVEICRYLVARPRGRIRANDRETEEGQGPVTVDGDALLRDFAAVKDAYRPQPLAVSC